MTTTFEGATFPAEEEPTGSQEALVVHAEPVLRVAVTLEVLLYALLVVLAVVLRVASLGDVPLQDAEAGQSLAVLRAIDPEVAGPALIADSPLSAALQTLGFTFLGTSNAAARLPVALGGVLLALAPALWRRYLNPLPPLILSALLTISPVAWLAARTLSPATWTMLLAIVGPWLVLRTVETHRGGYAVAATAVFAAMALLAEPAGFVTLLALAFGVAFAWLTEDDPGSEIGRGLRELWQGWPWGNGALAAGGLVLVTSTALFFLPGGLTAVGTVIERGIAGLTDWSGATPIGTPLVVALRYEPGVALFGLLAMVRAVRDGGFFDRALVGWALVGIVAGLAYPGATAAHALWVTLPLSVLLALTITRWVTERPGVMWKVPRWGVPLHAAITFGVWCAVGLSLVLMAKQVLVDLPAGVTQLGALVDAIFSGLYSRTSGSTEVIQVQDVQVFANVLGFIQLRALLTVLLSLLIGILYFLIGSLWGARTAWRGLALGTLGMLLLYGVGMGGRAAMTAGDPRELWHMDPVTDDVRELADTLETMSLRATGTPHLVSITAQVPDDGALAWALRGYPNTVFVNGVGPEVESQIVLAPIATPPPTLGAEYVGKDLIIRRDWSLDALSWRDMIMWLYRGATWVEPAPDETLMVWVRKDVYGVETVP